MSNGYRGLAFAALIAALLIAFSLGAFVTGLPNPQERYQSYQDGKANEGGPLAPVGAVANPVVERTPCNKPQSAIESDLCAQWRAAKAAEESALWTKMGFWVGFFGMIGLFWTLYYTREAVKDTGDATKAIIRQNEIAQDALKPSIEITMEGAYLHGSKAKIAYEKGNDRRTVWASPIIENIGDMPAIILEATIKLGVEGRETPFLSSLPRFVLKKNTRRYLHHIQIGIEHVHGPHTEIPIGEIFLTDENRIKMADNPPPIIGMVKFTDTSGIIREHHFAFAPRAIAFMPTERWGGKAYNYEKREEE